MKQKSPKSLRENEDTTKYGEFVTSYFAWLTPDKQKQKAESMEKITKIDEKSR